MYLQVFLSCGNAEMNLIMITFNVVERGQFGGKHYKAAVTIWSNTRQYT
jgi:hypothetical protein